MTMRCCEHGSTNGTKQRSREDKYFGNDVQSGEEINIQ